MPSCPWKGTCHGCASWCSFCGDVSTTCGFPSCQRHHCDRCERKLTEAEVDRREDLTVTCDHCIAEEARQEVMRAAEALMLQAGQHADESKDDFARAIYDINALEWGKRLRRLQGE